MDWPGWELELFVGETLQVGDVRITVVDIDGDEICFQIERPDSEAQWVPRQGGDRQPASRR
jgi:hypothetical protein